MNLSETFLFVLKSPVKPYHKLLCALLGSKDLDEVPPGLQCFQMRLTRFQFLIGHFLAMNLTTADPLSRGPISNRPQHEDKDEEQLPEGFMGSVQVTEEGKEPEELLSKALTSHEEGWTKSEVTMKPDWVVPRNLTMNQCLLLTGSRLATPGIKAMGNP